MGVHPQTTHFICVPKARGPCQVDPFIFQQWRWQTLDYDGLWYDLRAWNILHDYKDNYYDYYYDYFYDDY